MAKRKDATLATQRARARWYPIFLAELEETGNVAAACRVAGIDRSTAYRHRDADEEFAATWENNLQNAIDEVERNLYRHAATGDNVHAMQVYLRAHRPEYRDNSQVAVQVNNYMSPEEEQQHSDALMADVDAMTARMVEHRMIEEGDEEDS